MKIAVFGGTGRVGLRLIEYATAAGHEVRALVRDSAKLPANIPGLSALQGDVTDAAAVESAIAGADAVLSALGGAGLANPGTILSDGMRNIVAGMQRLGVRRVLAVAGSGVLDDPRGGLRGEAADFPPVYAAITREHRGTWDALKASQLDWTLVCCPDLVGGERTGRYRRETDRLPEGAASISVEDVADFMLSDMGRLEYVRRRVGLGY
ncbi:MAG: SDR family oxidoreductase [Gemmatimonadota bacterium]